MRKNALTRVIYTLIQWSWGIVQNAIGVLLFVIFLISAKIKCRKGYIRYYHGAVALCHGFHIGSMGLGMFMFFSDDRVPYNLLVHEWGHTVQSVILGPLFIPVIGIPSIMWAGFPLFVKLRREKHIKYDLPYCEKWASYIGHRLISYGQYLKFSNKR